MIEESSTTIDVGSALSPRVSVVIPAFAGKALLLDSLQALSMHCPRHIPYEVIVVLNRASPAFVADIESRVTGVRFVPSAVNLGLAGAANRGRASATGEILIVLHDDAEIEPGWMEALVDTSDTHPEAGIVGGKVLHPDGLLQSAGMILWRDATTSPPWVGEVPPPTAFDDLRQVDYCGTSSLLIRAAVWDALGGLDERFYPVYYVDVDLAMSVRRLGRVVLYQPMSRIRHHSGASGDRRWRWFVSERNREMFVEKWRTALDLHEPRDPHDEAATARAIARAAAASRGGGARWTSIMPEPPITIAPLPDQAYADKESELSRAYIQWLTATLEDVENQLAGARAATAAAEEELAALRAEVTYAPGGRLTFCEGGTAYAFQCSAIHIAESWGVWLGDAPFTIVLLLAPAPTIGGSDAVLTAWSLRLEAVPFLAQGRSQAPMSVSVDGQVVIEVIETQPGLHHYEGEVSIRAGSPPSRVLVTFKGGDAISPASLSSSGDARLLSFGLVALSLGPR